GNASAQTPLLACRVLPGGRSVTAKLNSPVAVEHVHVPAVCGAGQSPLAVPRGSARTDAPGESIYTVAPAIGVTPLGATSRPVMSPVKGTACGADEPPPPPPQAASTQGKNAQSIRVLYMLFSLIVIEPAAFTAAPRGPRRRRHRGRYRAPAPCWPARLPSATIPHRVRRPRRQTAAGHSIQRA